MNAHGYEKELLEDGLAIFRITSTEHACIDRRYQDIASVFAEARRAAKPARLIYDVRALNMPTPYSVRRAQELAQLALPEDWRVATLTGSSFITSITNLIRSLSLISSEAYERSRVFTDEAEAIDWLRRP